MKGLEACSREIKRWTTVLSKKTVKRIQKDLNDQPKNEEEKELSDIAEPDDNKEQENQVENAASSTESSVTESVVTIDDELYFTDLISIPEKIVEIECLEPKVFNLTPPDSDEELNKKLTKVIFNDGGSPLDLPNFEEMDNETLELYRLEQEKEFHALDNGSYDEWSFTFEETLSLMSIPTSSQVPSLEYSPRSTDSLMSIPAASQVPNLDYSSKSANSSTVIHIPEESATKQKIDWTIKRPDWSLERNISICKFTTEAKNKIKTATATANKNLKRSISKVFKGEQRSNHLRCIEDSQVLQNVQESQDSQDSDESQDSRNSRDSSDETYNTPPTDEEIFAGQNNFSQGCYMIINDNKAGKNTFTIGKKLTEIISDEVSCYFKYEGEKDSKILKSRICLCNSNEPDNCKEDYLKAKGIDMKLVEKYDKTDSSRSAAKYCPTYIQTICEKTGESIKNKGLCPYCPISKTEPYKNFYSLHDSSYLHHVTKIHGILRTGELIPSPVMSGEFIVLKSTGTGYKRAKHSIKQAVTCHCNAIIKVKDNDTDPKKQYLAYFRHYLENHYAGVNKSKRHCGCT